MLAAELLVGLLLLLGVPLTTLYARRRFLSRAGGAIEMSMRLRKGTHGRGWTLGIGRFVGDELQWFRVFSLSTRPRRTLSRRDLTVHRRRTPLGIESRALLKGAEVLELRNQGALLEVALEPSAITGFLAWLEAQPPGATLPA